MERNPAILLFCAASSIGAGCGQGSAASSTGATAKPGGSACAALTGEPGNAETVKKYLDQANTHTSMEKSHLTTSKCGLHGEIVTMTIGNGFTNETFFLREGVIVGSSYASDAMDHHCSGVIPEGCP